MNRARSAADPADLPDPPIPADVDLRDFEFMPLHVGRLRDSELADLSTGDEFKAATLLWAYAWHQVPPSLPSDERILAARSGARQMWPRVREMALRGFVRCSDGRLYHPIISADALDAWARRGSFKERQATRETRQQRWRAQCKRLAGLLRAAGVTPPAKPTKESLLALCRIHVAGFVDADGDASGDASGDDSGDAGRRSDDALDASEMRKTGTGTGTVETASRFSAVTLVPNQSARGGRSGDDDPDCGSPELAPAFRSLLGPPGDDGPSEANGIEPTKAGLICRAIKQRARFQSVNPGDPRFLAMIEQGVGEDEFVGVAQEAMAKTPPAGWAWVLTVVANRRQEAAAISIAPRPQDPTEWRRSADGLRRMAQQLGLDDDPAEGFAAWSSRIYKAWVARGEPAPTGEAG